MLSGGSQALPDPVTSPDGTRTVTWTADDASLLRENVTIDGVAGTLPWRPEAFRLSGGAAFASAGLMPAELETTPEGIELRDDSTNHVPSGDLASASPWTFASDAPGDVFASWDSAGLARVSHAGPEPNRTRWESFDRELNWTPALPADPIADSDPTTVSAGQKEGDGMMQDRVTTGLTPGSWAGVQRVGSFNWSEFDRILLWLFAPADLPVTFNVTALIASEMRGTSPVALVEGWQEVVLDLTPLGPERSSIAVVQLRFYGVGLSAVPFYIDDFRLTVARQVNGTGSLSQTVQKPMMTSAAWGTCLVSFRWRASSVIEIASLRIGMNLGLAGSPAPYATSFAAASAGSWMDYEADVSPWVVEPGAYELRLWASVRTNTTQATNGTVELDDVQLGFPARQNGTFVSDRIEFGGPVETVSFSWNASIPGSGSARLAFRAGNSTDPGDGSWGPWSESSSPGAHPDTTRARSFQVRAALETTNASETPRVEALELSVRQRPPRGTITTPLFAPEANFTRWLRILPEGTTGASSSFEAEFWNGSAWRPFTSEVDLAGAPHAMRARASLVSADRLESPALTSLTLVYDTARPTPPIWDWAFGNPWFVLVLVAAAGGYGAYAVAARQLVAIEDVFLVARDGRLIMHNTRRMRAQWDEDTFAGMLTAISAFVRDSFKEERGELNRFEFSGRTVLIERIDSMYVAALYAGHVPARALRNLKSFVADLEERYGERLRTWSGSPEDLQDLKELTARFVGRGRYRRLAGPRPAG